MTIYVLAMPLRNGRGSAVPVDLLRKVAKVVGRVALRRRLDREFSSYLVTEPVALPVWRHFETGRVVAIELGVSHVNGLLGGDGIGGEKIPCMDAPDYMCAGSMRAKELCGEVCAVARGFFRDGWLE